MLQKAIAIRPEFFDAYHNIGNVYRQQRRHHEASKAYSTAIVLNPEHPEARRMLGIALYTLGRTEEAAQHYRLWLEREPDNPVAAHMLAACSGTDIPSRASDSYVRQIFDSFSNSFDAKLSNLEYRAPELVRDAVSRRIENPAQDHDVLDLGCGTGLCGPLLKPYAKRLTGVDLSAGMLAKARARRHYDDLVEAELTRYLNDQNKNCDLIVCADTLCYFGELTRVFTALSGALRPNGLFVFTVELLSEEGSDANFKLDPSGRYSHAQPYVKHELESAGLAIKEIAPGNLRMENGLPVKGLVVTATLE
jgi:predicted TPR repeat methyltransferase